MANTRTRAHVAESAPTPADPDPDLEIPQPSESDDDNEAIETTTPISRKEKRKQKKQNRAISLPTPPDTDTDSTPSKTPNKKPKNRLPQPTPSIPTMPLGPSALQKTYPLLVCSLGNPGPQYAQTLHSAGHVITARIASVKQYKPFVKGLSGLVAYPNNMTYSWRPWSGYTKSEGGPPEDDWTFWQSTSLMNISGNSVKKAWSDFSRKVVAEGKEPRLVVVHDELESALGKVSVKEGGASPRGHNGLKSCQGSLGGVKWWRVGVGIGRPESREPDVVSRFVLRKMSLGEMKAMERACSGVVDALRSISEGKR